MKQQLKLKAITFRKEGKSYSEIAQLVPVSKATLSLWLRDVPLTVEQKNNLVQKRIHDARRGALKRKETRIKNTNLIIHKSKKDIGNLGKHELLIIGTCLYWAEGAKQKESNVSERVIFSNSDKHMIEIFLVWLDTICNVPLQRVKFELYIHESANTDDAINYWRRELRIDQNTTIAVRLKKHHLTTNRKNTGTSYHGLMRVSVLKSTDLNRKISGWIEGIIEAWGVV